LELQELRRQVHELERLPSMNDRRSIGRTKVARDALLFFSEHTGVCSCGVTDITNAGAGLRTQDLRAIPLYFELSFDKFRTSRNCRLIWRDGDFLGVAFES
jgi:hypothetical protein